MASPKSIVLIDDHPVVAMGVGLALRDSQNLTLAGIVADPAVCLTTLDACRPDALIIDLVFGGAVQLSLVTTCRVALPSAVIVVFSSLPDRLYARRAIEAGADAYVNKATDLSGLFRILASLLSRPPARPHRGDTRGAEDATARGQIVLENVHFTSREVEIARGLSRGLSVALIADAMGISSKTVASHRDNIRKKLDCRDTKDLVARLARMDGLDDAHA